MTDEECLQAFDELVRTLRDSGLVWVVDQVQSGVAVGQLQVVQISPAKAPASLPLLDDMMASPEPGGRRPGPKSDFTKTIDYSPQEKLRLLLQAVEHVLVRTTVMESESTTALGELLNVQAIEFASETTIEPGSTTKRLQPAQSLTALIAALRKEI
ncbi:MAG: hypothetical protein M3256_03800 [Actinomycetota bacterium]|nr:hypothetical protein [Candidatus Dormibacteraeota bacterium]MDQ6945397.1 hypothetical protein [Actinomycetota bacterium]